MKKLILGVILLASAMTYTTAQQAAVGTSPEASKWSIAPKGGITYYRVSPLGDGYVNDASWGAGLIIERTANPLFGLGLDLSYLNFNRSTVTGKTIDPTLFTSINMSNLLFPHRQSAKANVYTKFGAGVGFFNNKIGNVKDNGISPVFTAAIHPEVALSNVVALGAELGYRYYTKEILGGKLSKDRFDDALNLLATLRFNLGANHVRNMTMSDFYPAPAPVIMKEENPYDDSALNNRLTDAEKRLQDIQNRLNALEEGIKNLKAGETTTASFQNIEFKFDSSELTEASYPTLNQIADILKNNPNWGKLQINGHTDSTGPDAYNQKLSEARANSVKDYLISRGVSESMVATQGFGETKPIADNGTAEGRQANRRVEFEVSK